MKVLLGSKGMLAHELEKVIDFDLAFDKKALDITTDHGIEKLVNLKPTLIVNASAYTKVDDAESKIKDCFEVNALGIKNLVGACRKTKSKLVHFSTDYVFAGNNDKGYNESDLCEPVNNYGLSKLKGEHYITRNLSNYLIIRTSWLYGSKGNNFVDTMINLSKTKPLIKVVNDQFGKPTYTKDLAVATKEYLDNTGILHLTNDGKTSWYEFAKYILRYSAVEVVPCTSAEFVRAARRPMYSYLNNTKTKPLRHWKDAVDEYLVGRV